MKTAASLIAAILTAASAQAVSNTVQLVAPQDVFEAALDGRTAVIETALKQNYDVNAGNNEKRTALMFAAFNARTDTVKLLLDAGAEVNRQDIGGTSALMFAASAPNGKDALTLLLDAGADINMIDSNEHFTALMWAAAEGQAENVRLLLARGADTRLQDIDGDTAESFAAKAGHTAIAEFIKNSGAAAKATKN